MQYINTLVYRDRFVLLWRKLIPTGVVGLSADPIQETFFHMNYAFKGKDIAEVEFKDASASVPATGALFLCFLTNNNSATLTDNARVTLSTKVTYTDV